MCLLGPIIRVRKRAYWVGSRMFAISNKLKVDFPRVCVAGLLTGICVDD